MNLTAITEDVEILEKHFLDSLSILNHITLTADDAVIDIGTGAGFPGIVLKIYVPDIRLTLVEASQKKGKFPQISHRAIRFRRDYRLGIARRRVRAAAGAYRCL